MNIYEVNVVASGYRKLSYVLPGMSDEDACGLRDSMTCSGVPKERWIPPQMRLIDPSKPEPDFWDCSISGGLAAGPKAMDDVFMFFEMAGQVLPIGYKKLELSVLNILEVYTCIDEDRSEWRGELASGEPYGLLKPVFVPQHLESSTLFKTPIQPLSIYCWEQTKEPEDEFKACVESNKLTGLRFELIWSDEKLSRSTQRSQ